MPEQLTDNFYLHEFTRSQTAARRGIKVRILAGSKEHSNVKRLAHQLLQPARTAIGPCHITSGYRPPVLNALIGGSKTSAHTEARAADVVFSGETLLVAAKWIKANQTLHFDQLIYEFGQWLHISVAPEGEAPRRQVLTAWKERTMLGTKTRYAAGLRPDLVALEEESLVSTWWRKLTGTWPEVAEA